MKGIFLRRLLVLLIAALLVACGFMISSYIYFSRNAYMNMRLLDMSPEAEALSQLVKEYGGNALASDSFMRLFNSMVQKKDTTAFVVDVNRNITFYEQGGLPAENEAVLASLGEYIDLVLSGQRVEHNNVHLSRSGRMLMIGMPVTAEDGTVQAGVFLLESAASMDMATRRLNSSLAMLICVVMPLILLLSSYGVRRITAPLHNIAETALEIANGNLDLRLNENLPGEVGILARALNNLCEALSRTIYQLSTEKSRLDQLLYSLSDGVVATDITGALTHYNPAVMRMFGAVKADTREELISDESIWKAFDNVLESLKPVTLKYKQPGDRTLWITISPVNSQDGTVNGVVGLFKDMTELERLEQTRRDYVANVSHELRSPLTAMQGLLEPLSDGMVKNEEDRQMYYKIMLHEVIRLSRLITDMLTLSRLQSGTEYMEYSRVNVKELMTDVAEGFRQTAAANGITIITDIPEDLPYALTDSDRIEQVLIILIDNAIKFTPSGGTITVKAENGQKLTISVTDTGCGIPEQDLPHIFERFYKVDKSRNSPGTGLGLSIAKYIMEKLDESITVESRPDDGTTFKFTLKKYFRNAIPLGPAEEHSIKYAPPQTIKPADGVSRNEVQDAPYEVLNLKDEFK